MARFYVYELRRPDNTPFYVGKGTGKRIEDHEKLYRRGTHKNKQIVRVYDEIFLSGKLPSSVKVFESDDEEEALQYEKELIKKYEDSGTTLCNLIVGGSGFKSACATDEYRGFIARAVKLAWSNPDIRNKIVEGTRRTAATSEHKESCRRGQIGRRHPEATKAKMSESAKRRWESKEQRDILMKGILRTRSSEENRKKMSDTIRKMWESGKRKRSDRWLKKQQNLSQ